MKRATKKTRDLGRVIQKRFDSSIDRVRKKGHERLTVMIIPHGQEKIFSLQLNWLMITFLVGIVLSAVSLSGYAAYRQAIKQREVLRLKSMYGVNFNSAMLLSSNSRGILEENEELTDTIREISVILGFPESELKDLPTNDAARGRSRKELSDEALRRPDMGPGSDFLPTVYALKAARYVMHDRLPMFFAMRESLKSGVGVFSTMPLGRPFRGFGGLSDTSSYGVRTDPVTNAGVEFHTGFDTSGPEGTPVYATGGGVIKGVMLWDPGYGNAVIVEHENGFHSLYAHMSSVQVTQGKSVNRGDLIGTMGHTGRVTGSHLHYEVWMGYGLRVDPAPFICGTDLATGTCRTFNRDEQ